MNLFLDVFNDFIKDYCEDMDIPALGNSYKMMLTSDGDSYNMSYSSDDKNGKLTVKGKGATIEDCTNDFLNNLDTVSVEKQKEDVDAYVAKLETDNKDLKDEIDFLRRQIDVLSIDAEHSNKTNKALVERIHALESAVDDMIINLTQIDDLATDALDTHWE